MTESYYFLLSLLGVELLARLCLLAPYLSGERSQLIAVTSIYRPLSLIFLTTYSIITAATLDIPGTALRPILYLWGVFFLALEIRYSRGSRRDNRPLIMLSLFITAAIILFSFLPIANADARYNELVHTLCLGIVYAFAMVECVKAVRVSRNYHYYFVIAALLIAITLRLSFTAMILVGGINWPNLNQTNVDYAILFRFTSAGFITFALLALNNIYCLKLWRSNLTQRQRAEIGVFSALKEIANVRDNQTGQHIMRTRLLVQALATNLAHKGTLDNADQPNAIMTVARAAPLHDIGKVAVPDRILLKPGRLNETEMQEMRQHATVGGTILNTIADAIGTPDNKVIAIGADIAGGHHENWDGSGYPNGLIGKEIPQSARIMAVADMYDALTSARPYKGPWSHDEAVAHIIGLSGTKFDPDVVAAFVEEAATCLDIATRYRDAR